MAGQNINIMNSCSTLTTADFFREMPGIPKATVYSRIRSMVIRGIVQRVGRGVYERAGKSAFAFEASESMRAIAQKIFLTSIIVYGICHPSTPCRSTLSISMSPS